LISTWPVAGGVVVHDGVVYAAAGIAHYDGTHVAALDAVTGAVKWYNNTSGTLSEKVNCGISLQGSLYLRGNELCFLGGGVYHTARYALDTGTCLNEPYDGVNSRHQTSFYAYYPSYGQYVSLHHSFPDGTSLRYEASYEGSRHSPLARLAPPAPNAPQGRRAPRPKALWERGGGRYNGLIVAPETVLAAGQAGTGGSFLAAISLKDGSDRWRESLPAAPVKGGLAVDHAARIYVSLRDGRIVCYSGE
jgi:outer membrane protein assembly factor BamB